ncbi:MAG: DUF547 domain-containing protein [Thermoanaerobaculia bacterium]
MKRSVLPDRARTAAFVLLLTLGPACAAERPTEAANGGEVALAAWERLLTKYARGGGVDYAGVAADRVDLDAFLDSLAGARPGAWPRDEQLAFWINAYNAVVIGQLLERYPGIGSVQDVDGFFAELTFPVAGRQLTLDQIETAGRELGDPRVHFAVVCASTSCPDLRPEAYMADRVQAQLADQSRRFLSDPEKGLRLDAQANTLWLSSIFKWYAGDFTGGSTVVAFFARGDILGWVAEHVPAPLAKTLRERKPSVRYLDYDWALNDRP